MSDVDDQRQSEASARPRTLIARISRLEWTLAAIVVIVGVGLTIAEPAILEAPFENARTIGFCVVGTVAAAVVLILMLRFRVPAPLRAAVLGVPFVVVSWWLISPFFIDDVVNDDFATSIAEAAQGSQPATTAPATVSSPATTGPSVTASTTTAPATVVPPPLEPSTSTTTSAPTPPTPALLGAGHFRGLAGHEGTGDAGIFRVEDGSHVLRLENLDIQNGPDLRLYVIEGADQLAPTDGSIYLGELRGNVGNQTYDLPADFVPTTGAWTVLVWCEAFSVEFVGASLSIA